MVKHFRISGLVVTGFRASDFVLRAWGFMILCVMGFGALGLKASQVLDCAFCIYP